jgi:hypothetical protein
VRHVTGGADALTRAGRGGVLAPMRHRLVPVGLLLAVAACESTSSDGIRTSAIYADMSAVGAVDSSVEVTAFLKVGGGGSNTFVDLAAGDELIAKRGGTEVVMERFEVITDAVGYRASFPPQGQGGSGVPFTIDFERADDESALGSTVSMPALFAPTAPASGAQVSRATALTVAWAPAGTGMLWATVSSTCASTASREIPDSGALTIEPGDWSVTAGAEAETCAATIILQRETAGTVAAAFGEGGRFTGVQRREISVQLAP